MFGIGFGELLVIGVLLLIAVGPRRMPVMMKSMGRAMREFRKATRELRAQVGLDELMGEDDVLRPMKKVPRPVRPAPSSATPSSAPAHNAATSNTTARNAAPSSTTARNAAPSSTTARNAAPSSATTSADAFAEESTDDAEEDDAQAAARAILREYPPDGVDVAESRDLAARNGGASAATAPNGTASSGTATNGTASSGTASSGTGRALASAPLAPKKVEA